MARHAQITQNNKSYISLQYLKKEVGADEHEIFLQIDPMNFVGNGAAFPKLPNSKFALEDVRHEVDFLQAYKHQIFLQVDLITFSINVSYKVILSR